MSTTPARIERWRTTALLLAMALVLTCGDAGAATRRILLVGDSWPFFMWMARAGDLVLWEGRAFQETLIERGYGQWEEWGQPTAIPGSMAREWAENEPNVFLVGKLDLIARELEENPNIDIVHLSLGGNDYLRGDYSEILGDYTFHHGWQKAWTDEEEELFFGAICADIRVVIEFALDVRPDVRVALCGYDYMTEARGGGTVQETNEAGVRLAAMKLALCQEISTQPQHLNRCFYVAAYGLMQYTFGYPWPFGSGDQIYGPMGEPGTGGTIEAPGGYPTYVPLPGGDITYPSPMGTLLDDIHLNQAGYWTLARHCIDEFYGEWLDLPKVLQVTRVTQDPVCPGRLYNPTGADFISFEVTFTEAVTGVDEADFDVLMQGGLAGAMIESVAEAKDGATYTVTAGTGSGNGTLALAVLDNDSILDGDLNPLGGPGANNGYFAYGAPYDVDESATVPIATWPVAAALAMAAAAVLRRRAC